LYASQVISDQVRHRTTDQGDQYWVETSNCLVSRGSITTVTDRVYRCLREERSGVRERLLLSQEFFLVFEQDSGYSSLVRILD
jgi:hypothetical protein